jgi:hypothetical protein
MTLPCMRARVRSVETSCPEIGSGHDGVIDMDHLRDDLAAPEVALRLCGSACGLHDRAVSPGVAPASEPGLQAPVTAGRRRR